MATLPQISPPEARQPRPRRVTNQRRRAPIEMPRRRQRSRLWLEIVLVLLVLLLLGWAVRRAEAALTLNGTPRLVGALLIASGGSTAAQAVAGGCIGASGHRKQVARTKGAAVAPRGCAVRRTG